MKNLNDIVFLPLLCLSSPCAATTFYASLPSRIENDLSTARCISSWHRWRVRERQKRDSLPRIVAHRRRLFAPQWLVLISSSACHCNVSSPGSPSFFCFEVVVFPWQHTSCVSVPSVPATPFPPPWLHFKYIHVFLAGAVGVSKIILFLCLRLSAPAQIQALNVQYKLHISTVFRCESLSGQIERPAIAISSTSPNNNNTNNDYGFRTETLWGWKAHYAAWVNAEQVRHTIVTNVTCVYIHKNILLYWANTLQAIWL